MKTTITLLLCILVGMRSFQQTVSSTQFISSQHADLASTLISTPSEQAKTSGTCKGKRIYLTKGSGDNGIYLDGSSFSYNAGDTLVLKSSQNPYSYVTLHYFNKGTAACPVVITNEGGQVVLNSAHGDAIPGGFEFFSCTHIRVTGTGSTMPYGFLVTTPDNLGAGLNVYGHSAYFEIDHLKIYKKGVGMWIKQEDDCADSLMFPNWVLHDFKIHDNTIKNIISEGMYLGSTDPNGTRSIVCNGATVYPKPPRLGNFTIYNNTIDSTGRGGIQLSSADQGTNEIRNNKITHVGYEFNTAQGNGIVLGGYTQANVHDNTIDSSYSSGIYSLGAGLVIIQNNTVNHSGMLAGKTTNGMSSIMVDTRNTTNISTGLGYTNPEKVTFQLLSNKLGSNTDYNNNIRVYNTYLTFNTNNQICSNTQISTGAAAQLAVATGIVWNACTGKSSAATAENLKNVNNTSYLYPNPASDIINIKLASTISGKVAINIFDAEGRLLLTKTIDKNVSSQHEAISVKNISAGTYTLQIISGTEKSYFKFIKE